MNALRSREHDLNCESEPQIFLPFFLILVLLFHYFAILPLNLIQVEGQLLGMITLASTAD